MSAHKIRWHPLVLAALLVVRPVSAADPDQPDAGKSALRRAAAAMPSVQATLHTGLGIPGSEQTSCKVVMKPSGRNDWAQVPRG